MIAQVLRENTAMSFDASLFSNAAATTASPAGILNGVAALTATAGGGELAMMTDLAALAAAISGATANLAFATNPAQAHRIPAAARYDVPRKCRCGLRSPFQPARSLR